LALFLTYREELRKMIAMIDAVLQAPKTK